MLKNIYKVFVCQNFAMSRCFPFPPPGYERKLDDTELLKKEKRKEKKHKKDKKDGEKRDGKEKKDDRKHKEKKDKNREKKKDKEKSVDQRFESQNREPLLQNNDHSKQKGGSSGHKKSSLQPRNGEHKQLLIAKEEYVQPSSQNENMLVNGIKTEDIDNFKIVQELGRRIREDEKRTGSLQFPVDSRKSNVDRGEIPKTDSLGITHKSTFNRMSTVQSMIDGKKTHEKVKEKTELTKAEVDKNKYTKSSKTIGSFNNLSTYNTPNVGIQHYGSELKKRKDMETNGFSHENEPRPNKAARPASYILSENGRKQDFLQNPGLSQPGKSSKMDTKEQKVNGAIASQPMSPVSKKPPMASANHILVKPTSTRSPPVNRGHIPSQPVPASRPPSSVPNNITSMPPPESSTKPSQPLLKPKKKESIRLPHPDTKYLKQILAVPELDQWSSLDNQEWLFSSKDHPHFNEKARNMLLQDNKEVEVWSEAKQLESVDVYALPYVIPY